ELVGIKNKRTFLSSIYQTVYLGDIITRNKVTNDFAIRLILKKIAESITKPLSFTRLTNILKSAGTSLGKQTIINYVGYMTESYLLFTLHNYAAKLVEKESSPKYYFMDTGFLGLMLLNCKSAQLENLVAIELIRRYGVENVYFFENNVEIDFYVPSQKLAIQVSMQVLDNMDTKERETRAFVKLNNFIPDARCILITNSEEATLNLDGVKIDVVPVWKWLLE
ncbi:MAG: ATP-binding protein, partial [Butyrivibrio sp.]